MENKFNITFNDIHALSNTELLSISGGRDEASVGGAIGFVLGVACCFVCKFGKELGTLMATK